MASNRSGPGWLWHRSLGKSASRAQALHSAMAQQRRWGALPGLFRGRPSRKAKTRSQTSSRLHGLPTCFSTPADAIPTMGKPGPIRTSIWSGGRGGNPFHHHQDLNRLETAWCRPETVIVNDHSWTATARRADIVFPATTSFERNDIMINRRDSSLLYMSRLFDPLGDAKSDFEIFSRLSAAMGFEDQFTEGLLTRTSG